MPDSSVKPAAGDAATVRADAAHLAAHHPRFARAAAVAGDFPVPYRPAGFATLLWIILEQQVSIRAARAMYTRLEATCVPLVPQRFRDLDDATLRRCGFTRQKAGYARGLADAVLAGTLDLDNLHGLPDEAVIDVLTACKGLGRWSAECYLIWALGRRDVLPAGDLALQIGWQWLCDAPSRPPVDSLRAEAAAWRPRRTAAALLIWYFYLGVLAQRRGGGGALDKPPGGG